MCGESPPRVHSIAKFLKKQKICYYLLMTTKIKRLDIAGRRAAVAKMIARGYDSQAVANKLTSLGYKTINGKPITARLIGIDLKEVEKLWMEKATADISRHKSRQFHELQKIKQVAWKKQDFDLLLKVLDKEMVLLGTKVTGIDREQPKYVKNETNQQFNILTVDERDERINKILESARKKRAVITDGSGPNMETVAAPKRSV